MVQVHSLKPLKTLKRRVMLKRAAKEYLMVYLLRKKSWVTPLSSSSLATKRQLAPFTSP
jgi:hypothetical protein